MARLGGVRVGYIDGQFVANPEIPMMEHSQLDLRMAGTRDAIIMVEAGANEIPEDVLVEALAFGHKAIQSLIDVQLQMREAVGKPKRDIQYATMNEAMVSAMRDRLGGRLKQLVADQTDRHDRGTAVDELREEIINEMVSDDESALPKDLLEVFGSEFKKTVRSRILYEGVRPDGRDYRTIRSLSAEVGLSPRAHGSGLFQRGETQVLSIVALGTPREAQKLDGLHPDESRRYIHHYNFPPFSTGETWTLRGPKRREIGHGALAETALRYVIPSEEEFPYTIRVVSEVLSSNGSTSQASVCASTLALMDTGVPLRRPVAGIAMGLVSDGAKYAILTDIQGVEDHLGDMDFKVAGTTEGITALQMDIKISGLTQEIMAEALAQAREARLQILDVMLATIPAPRAEMSKYAPRMESIKIDPEKIGAVIGKGGSTIRGLEEAYQVSIDIQEDGTIFVAGVDGIKTDAALNQIRTLTMGAELGQTYTGKVVRITDFGAFIEILPGMDGLVHISQLAKQRINRVEDSVQLGDEVMVMVTDIDPSTSKIRLSRRAVLENWTLEEARANDMANKGPKPGGGDRGGRDNRSGGGDRGGRDNRSGGGGNRYGGPRR